MKCLRYPLIKLSFYWSSECLSPPKEECKWCWKVEKSEAGRPVEGISTHDRKVMEADKCTFLGLRQRRTSISDSVRLLSPTVSDFYLRQRRTTISDSVGLLSPIASDYNFRQRRTTISDSVGLQSPTASDFNLQQLAS